MATMLLPLLFSASALRPGAAERQDADVPNPPAEPACRYCGFRPLPSAGAWLAHPALDADAVTGTPARCIHCHLCANLARDTIEREARLVWLPEVTQAALNATVRRLHLVCRRHGAEPTMDGVPRVDGPEMRRAWGVYSAFLRRTAPVERQLGTASARDLGAALASTSCGGTTPVGLLLGGLRLLPVGRYFRDGADVYPDLLDALLAASGQAAGVLPPHAPAEGTAA